MLDMESLAAELQGSMTLYENPDTETRYLSDNIHAGAMEIYADGTIMYTTWDRTGGVSEEAEIGNVPLGIPVAEQVCFIRIFRLKLIELLNKRDDSERYHVAEECRRAIHENRQISHGTAKVIASFNIDDIDDIQLFLANGSIESIALWHHLYRDYKGDSMYNRLSGEDQLFADSLGSYLANRRQTGQTGPVENWSNLWVDRP